MFNAGAGMLELLEDLHAVWPVTSCDVSLRVTNVWALWKECQAQPNVVFGLRDNPWGDTSFCIVDPGGFQLTFFTPQRTDEVRLQRGTALGKRPAPRSPRTRTCVYAAGGCFPLLAGHRSQRLPPAG